MFSGQVDEASARGRRPSAARAASSASRSTRRSCSRAPSSSFPPDRPPRPSGFSPILPSCGGFRHLSRPAARAARPPPPVYGQSQAEGIWAAGDRIAWISGLVLMLSTFMDWYAGSGLGVKLAVIGWHTGTAREARVLHRARRRRRRGAPRVRLRAAGVDPREPRGARARCGSRPCSCSIRVINIPDAVLPADSRGIGLWIASIAALGVDRRRPAPRRRRPLEPASSAALARLLEDPEARLDLVERRRAPITIVSSASTASMTQKRAFEFRAYCRCSTRARRRARSRR